MPNTKRFTIAYTTGQTIYLIVTRQTDGYFLNDADGAFAAAPADPYLALTENPVTKGVYLATEARAAWNDGRYTLTFYSQMGGAPDTASDMIVKLSEILILADQETSQPVPISSATDAKTIIDRAKKIAGDTDGVEWDDSYWLAFLNAGQLEAANKKPSLSSKRYVLQLAAGSKQSMPVDGISLLDVTCNMGAGGNTPGGAIRPMSKEQLDSLYPDWRSKTQGLPKYFMYDPQESSTFLVYPPASETCVEIVYSAVPSTILDLEEGTKITIQDEAANALLDYVLHRAFSKDAETGNAARAAAHYQAFLLALGGGE